MAPLLLLTGFMGSGKTTVGREVARRLGWGFLDLDRKIAADAQKDLPTIFAEEGEAGFRKRESTLLEEVVRRASPTEGLVVALGGGTLIDPANAALVKGRAWVVYLDIELEEAWKRVCRSDRPLAQNRKVFEQLLAERRPVYESVADLTISVGEGALDSASNQIVQHVRRGSEAGA
ncbi:MAG TPA: shikimate kinase [Thermoleophilia bacterium]|nr:shikimate kinase [Thermoleophilia bacterium]